MTPSRPSFLLRSLRRHGVGLAVALGLSIGVPILLGVGLARIASAQAATADSSDVLEMEKEEAPLPLAAARIWGTSAKRGCAMTNAAPFPGYLPDAPPTPPPDTGA